jgi:hypothetical protein
MGLIKNQSVSMYVDASTGFREIEPAGTRCKLYGIQVGVYSALTNRLFEQVIDPDDGRNVQLRTGSSTGSVLFDVAIPFVSATYYYVGELPYVFNLDPNYVLFDDGIFMDEISDIGADTGGPSADPPSDVKKLFGDYVQLSLFYEI